LLEGGGGLLDVRVALDGSNSLGGLGFAASVLGGVWVGGLKLEFVGFDVVEGLVHKSTVATHVAPASGGAVNELLFREGLEGSTGEEIGSFNGSNSGESPA